MEIAYLYVVGRKRRILMKNRGKGQNPGILIKYAITVRKRATSRRSVSSCRIGRRNSRTNKERNLGNLVKLVLWNQIRPVENFWLCQMLIQELVRIGF